MDSSGEEETPVRSVEKKAKKSKKHKKHKKSSKSENPEKRAKSSKKKRRHSGEGPEEGHRSHKVKKSADSKPARVVPESLQNVAQATTKRVTVGAAAPTVSTIAAVSPKKKRPSDAAEASVPPVKRDRKSSSGSEKNPQSHNHQPHIVTTKSNGQSKLLTHPKSSKLGGGIPTDPSKLVEILTKAAPEPATEILSSDSEANDR